MAASDIPPAPDSASPTPVQLAALAAPDGALSAASTTLGVVGEAAGPARPGEPIAVVGLGASAGGIQVLGSILEGIPRDSGLAFVVVMHLSPDFESSLAQVLQHRSALPVEQVTGRVRVEPNRVYVIPPARHIAMEDSHLLLTERQDTPGQRVAIDLFFRTLAASYGQRSVCAVLSGTDSDGSIGLKHIKEQGGVTIAQDPDQAEYDSMPRTAIGTGMVDWVLKAEEIAPRLIEFADNERRMQLPPEDSSDGDPAQVLPEHEKAGGRLAAAQVPSAKDEDAMSEVLVFLRARTGHDFGHYKRATVLRRIARRMQVNTLEDIPSYLKYLQANPPEVPALLGDLLINVTNFFRDPEAFAALQAHIPQLFAGKEAEDQVRVWVCGCATGEEAYTVAILLHEHASKLAARPTIQVFATDLDADAIAQARQGLYSLTIEADVSAERLRRFFVSDQGRYRVRQEIRDTVLFAMHDVLKDPPFSRLDMVTCRNLLIYLKREAQERVFDIFHFALRAGGLLFLGSSESLNETHMLFAPLEKKHRLYLRRATARPSWQIPAVRPSSSLPLSLRAAEEHGAPEEAAPLQVLAASDSPALPASTRAAPAASGAVAPGLRLGDLHLQALEEYAPPSLLVNESYDIVHLSPQAGKYLQMAGGEPSVNLLQVVHPDLRIELRTSLFRAVQNQTPIVAPRVRATLDGVPSLITLQVRPLRGAGAQGLILVVFEDGGEAGAQDVPAQVLGASEAINFAMESENGQLKAQLSATVEQYEASTEELKASNEELQAINEELRSAGEELQTSKEELQSVNEELTTVNAELKSNLDEVGRLNSDLQNLLTSTEIGTIFLDRQFRVKRFTPRVQELFNLIPTDIGRPLSDITHKIEYENFASDAAQVLRTLATVEREVHVANDGWFIARLSPYRTLDDRIDGVVLTFVDITARKEAEEAVREAQESLQIAVEAAEMGTWDLDLTQDFSGRRSARHDEIFGYDAAQPTWGREVARRHVVEEDRAAFDEAFDRAMETGELRFEVRVLWPDSSIHWMAGAGRFTFDADGKPLRGAGVNFDITERKQAEEAVRESEEKFRTLFESIDEGFCIFEVFLDEGGRVVDLSWLEANPAFEAQSGLRDVMGQRASEYFPLLEQAWLDAVTRVQQTGEAERMEGYNADTGLWISSHYSRVGGPGSTLLAAVFDDITERKAREEQQKYLLRLSDALRAQSGPDAIGALATRMLAEHMKVDRCHVIRISRAQQLGWVGPEHHASDLPPLSGEYRFADFPASMERLESAPLVIHDLWDDGSLSDADKHSIEAMGMHAALTCALRRGENDSIWAINVGTRRPRRWTPDEIALVEEVAERTWTAIERAKGEADLRESEEKFRTLFESIDEGFCIFELLYDGEGNAVDWIYTEANPAFEKQAGFINPIGKRISELQPDLERSWFERFAEVARTGEPVRFVQYTEAMGIWYDVYALRVGEASASRVSLLFTDITERKQRELNTDLLDEIGKDLSVLSAPDEIMQAVGKRLSEFLELSGCYFVDVDEARNEVTVHHGWASGKSPSLMQTFNLKDYLSEDFGRTMRAGEVFVMRDTARDERAEAQSYARLQVGSFVTVPFFRDGRYTGHIAVTTEQTHDWQPPEIQLLQEISSRVLPRIERARAEKALHESEARLQKAISIETVGVFFFRLDGRITGANEAALRMSGYRREELVGVVNLEALTDPKYLEAKAQAERNLAERGETPPYEKKMVRADGSHWWGLFAPTRLRGEGEASECVEFIVDITESRRAQEAVREASERLRIAVEAAEMGTWDWDIPGDRVFWNERHFTMLGMEPTSEPIGSEEFISRIHPDDRGWVGERLGQAVESGATFVAEFRAIRDDGEERWMSGYGQAVEKGADGQTTRMSGVMSDMTDRRRVEEAVRQSEARFRALISQGADMITVSDREGRITYASPTTETVSGYTPQEFMALDPFELMHPDDRERCQEALQVLVATPGLSLDLQHRILRKDGAWRWVEGSFTSLFEVPGIGGLVANVRDITERQRAEEAVRESEARLRTLSDAVPQVIWTNDAEGVANYFNSRWFEYAGLSLEESMGLGWEAIVHPEDAPSSKYLWQQALQRGEIFDTEYRLRRGDGAYRWFIGRNVPLRDEERGIVGWFGSATDIEDLKSAESSLRESEERLQKAIDIETVGVLFFDDEGCFTDANDAFLKMIGAAREQLALLCIQDITPPEWMPRVQAAMDELTSTGRVTPYEKELLHSDGSRWWALLAGAQLAPNQNIEYIVDISERRRAQAALQQAHSELEARVQQRTTELRAEIVQRQGLEQERERLMRGIVAAQEDERRRLSRDLHDQMGQTLTALMLGLKMLPVAEDPGLSKPTPGERLLGLQSMAGELADYAHHLAWELRPAVLDNIGLEAALGQYVSGWTRRSGVAGDFVAHGLGATERLTPELESTLYRAVQEALSNVARHAHASQVSVVLERQANEARVLIEDNGAGFDVGQSSNRLGLVGMRERLELVGGTLSIESAPGDGTVIYGRVPLAPRSSPGAAPTTPQVSAEPSAPDGQPEAPSTAPST